MLQLEGGIRPAPLRAWQNAESPGYLSIWSYATYDGVDLVVRCRVASDSPAGAEQEGRNECCDASILILIIVRDVRTFGGRVSHGGATG